MRQSSLVVLLLFACAARGATPPGPTPVVAEAPRVEEVAAAPAVAVPPSPYTAAVMCAGEGPWPVRVHVEDVDLECADGRLAACAAELRFAVANCGAAPVVVRAVRFEEPADARRALILEPGEGRLAPGAEWAWRTHMTREQVLRMRAVVDDEQGVAVAVAERLVRVANPTRAAAMAACAACDGVWGIQGLVYRDACNCRARDAGQACRDGGACEGVCVFDRWDITAPAEPVRCTGKKCPTRPAGVGRPIGRCSQRVAVRGCHALLQRGVADRADEAVPWGVSRVCID